MGNSVDGIRGTEFTSQTSAEAHRLAIEKARADAEERRAKALTAAATAALILDSMAPEGFDLSLERLFDGAMAKAAIGVVNGTVPIRNGAEAAAIVEKFSAAKLRIMGGDSGGGSTGGDLSHAEALQNAIEIRDAASARAQALADAQEDHGEAPAPT